jgi:predicted GTPase
VGHENFTAGEVNFLRAQVLVINKADSASRESWTKSWLPSRNGIGPPLQTASRISVENGERIRGKKVWRLKTDRPLP